MKFLAPLNLISVVAIALCAMPGAIPFPAIAFNPEDFERLRVAGACIGCDLSGLRLTDVYLFGADLSYSNLTGTNLAGANLSGAYLERAILKDASLTNADLENADLTNTILTNTKLQGANLTGAVLTGANLDDADVTGARFCKTTMPDGLISNLHC